MLRVQGIVETAIYVRDLVQAARFYRDLFGFATLFESDRLVALNVADGNVLLIFKAGATDQDSEVEGGMIPGHSGSGRYHFAFAVAAEDIAAWRDRLASAGIAVEGEVAWPRGAHSLYFRDPDEHLVELLTPGFWANY
jgi:catechol 2,3-dioxygenase-like lactoylglutathione lyase family enzyme